MFFQVVGSASTLKTDEHWKNLVESAEKRNVLLKVNIRFIFLDLFPFLFLAWLHSFSYLKIIVPSALIDLLYIRLLV